ncbi:RHS repeat-associated core domain-containing protein [Chitinophaga sp. 30R24]|uniref:RHS repeat-associated core domain-containing protein n=1 Tax=Chitinophaga sp. 30R24 TaxID=3248838 RepID=UPI003B90E6F0
MGVNLSALGQPLLYTYQYDVLNRLGSMTASRGLNTTTNTWVAAKLPDFEEVVDYDANGNIQSYHRNGNNTFAGEPLAMDELTYHYRPGNNQLDYIDDQVPDSNYSNDIDRQYAHNYSYDETGNLISDRKSDIDSICWTVYGKIERIRKSDGTVIAYTYDAVGNRIGKRVKDVETWYVRDATGNVMGVYTKGDPGVNHGDLTLISSDLYGSTRLGLLNRQENVQHITVPVKLPMPGLGNGINTIFSKGNKLFELSNHLGNVLSTVSDKKLPYSSNGTTIDYYRPDIVSTQDYYAFGMLMPGRKFNGQADTSAASLPAPSPVWGSPSQPVALYQNGFEQAPYNMPYTGAANTHAYISNSSWTNSRTTDTTWTTYAGVSNAGHSLALPSSAPETSTIRLTFDVDPGYELNVSSFSFYHRSSYTGYQNYSLTINGIPVSPPPSSGADTIYVDVSGGSHVMRSTGTLAVSNPVTNLMGKVTVEVTLSNRTGNQGTFRIDNFTLNGYVTPIDSSVYNSVPGRYRYGFNGKENDNEVKGEGNQQDYGMRIYDPRIGKFLSVDPLTQSYPWYTPYQYPGNTPIQAIDIDGLEPTVTPISRGVASRPALSNTYVDPEGNLTTRPNRPMFLPGTGVGVMPNEGVSPVTGGYLVTTPNGGFYVGTQRRERPLVPYQTPQQRQFTAISEQAKTASYYFNRDLNQEKPLGSMSEPPKLPISNLEDKDSKNRKVIGLGLDQDLSNHRWTEAIIYKNAGWQLAGLTKVDFGRASMDNFAFMESFRQSAQNADAINFDVTHFDPTIKTSSITSKEFNHIISDPALLKKTTFTRDGKNVNWNGSKFED